MASVSAVVNVEALAPPVPSFEIAAMASAGTVRDDWEVAPARTVAMFVVLSTEAVPRERSGSRASSFILSS